MIVDDLDVAHFEKGLRIVHGFIHVYIPLLGLLGKDYKRHHAA
jgi:hypothetical protein